MKISLLEFIEGKEKKVEIEKNLDEDFKINNLNFINPISVLLQLYKVDKDISGSIKVKYKYTEECSRCLKKYKNIIEKKEDLFISSEKISSEDKDADVFYIQLQNGYIEIDDVVEEIFHINRPLKPLCEENCKGLCPECGTNLNDEKCDCDTEEIDPRMEQLKDLLDEEV
jgi:uncharacterized protein